MSRKFLYSVKAHVSLKKIQQEATFWENKNAIILMPSLAYVETT